MGEFGSNQTVGATIQRDIDRYERGLLMARIVVNLLNAGASGASYWSLLDQYYSRGEALAHRNMQRLGLWRYLRQEYAQDSIFAFLTEDYQVRPQYYAIGMISRHVRPGCEVFPLETGSEWVAATALRSEAGKWCYLIVNPTAEAIDIELQNPHCPHRQRLQVWRYQEATLPMGDSLPRPAGRTLQCRGKIRLTAEPYSFVIAGQD